MNLGSRSSGRLHFFLFQLARPPFLLGRLIDQWTKTPREREKRHTRSTTSKKETPMKSTTCRDTTTRKSMFEKRKKKPSSWLFNCWLSPFAGDDPCHPAAYAHTHNNQHVFCLFLNNQLEERKKILSTGPQFSPAICQKKIKRSTSLPCRTF